MSSGGFARFSRKKAPPSKPANGGDAGSTQGGGGAAFQRMPNAMGSTGSSTGEHIGTSWDNPVDDFGFGGGSGGGDDLFSGSFATNEINNNNVVTHQTGFAGPFDQTANEQNNQDKMPPQGGTGILGGFGQTTEHNGTTDEMLTRTDGDGFLGQFGQTTESNRNYNPQPHDGTGFPGMVDQTSDPNNNQQQQPRSGATFPGAAIFSNKTNMANAPPAAKPPAKTPVPPTVRNTVTTTPGVNSHLGSNVPAGLSRNPMQRQVAVPATTPRQGILGPRGAPPSNQNSVQGGATAGASNMPTFKTPAPASLPPSTHNMASSTETTIATGTANDEPAPPPVTPATAGMATTPANGTGSGESALFKGTLSQFDTSLVSPESSKKHPGSDAGRTSHNAATQDGAVGDTEMDLQAINEESFVETLQSITYKQLRFDDGISAYGDTMLELTSALCFEHANMLTFEASTLHQMEEMEAVAEKLDEEISSCNATISSLPPS